jgi:proteasome lid subunit RPN8/RPN11
MLNEEEMVDVILGDARGIYPLGWIHTHPSQSCFMSSIDVHTQAGYQASPRRRRRRRRCRRCRGRRQI